MELVLNEIDDSYNLPRTERKLSRAVSFAPNAHAQEERNISLSLSNKLMSSFNQVGKDFAVIVNQSEEKNEESVAGIGDGKE
jgi:hypothetical protein